MYLVSVIVPVYNAKDSIEACLNALLTQVYKKIEIILINDGSTDNGGALMEEYAKKDNRVKVIHTKNNGQGLARNLGLSHATGDYIYFADADDLVEPKGIYYMMQTAKKFPYDVIAGMYYRQDKHSRQLVGYTITEGKLSRSNGELDKKRYHQIKTESLFGYLWNKVYRREFLLLHNLVLDDIRNVYMEDTLFNLKVFAMAPNYYYCKKPVYCYIAEGTSTTRKPEPEIAIKNTKVLTVYYNYLKQIKKRNENMDLMVPLAMRVFCWSLVRNIVYEGPSYQKLKERIAIFMENKCFVDVIHYRYSYRELKKLKKLPEKVFYLFCLTLLTHKKETWLALVFYSLQPVMQCYINKTLK